MEQKEINIQDFKEMPFECIINERNNDIKKIELEIEELNELMIQSNILNSMSSGNLQNIQNRIDYCVTIVDQLKKEIHIELIDSMIPSYSLYDDHQSNNNINDISPSCDQENSPTIPNCIDNNDNENNSFMNGFNRQKITKIVSSTLIGGTVSGATITAFFGIIPGAICFVVGSAVFGFATKKVVDKIDQNKTQS